MKIEMVARRMDGVVSATRLELTRGLDGLGAIAYTAPMLGLLGTAVGLIENFRPIVGERSLIVRGIAFGMLDALFPMGLGLIVAIPALWGHRYLCGRAWDLETEMRNVAAELVNWLGR